MARLQTMQVQPSSAGWVGVNSRGAYVSFYEDPSTSNTFFFPASPIPQYLPFISSLCTPTSRQSPSLSPPLAARSQSTTAPPAARASKIGHLPQSFLRSNPVVTGQPRLLQLFGYLAKNERKGYDLAHGINNNRFCWLVLWNVFAFFFSPLSTAFIQR